MLQTSGMPCYADHITRDALYRGRSNISREQVDECRNKLVSEIKSLLAKVSQWGQLNIVQFYPKKAQVYR
ncbi:unnamed protein product [Euphydryas editha]|uniref:Uncharacterized protein n=1 Tax=Euphydryas editha TaxID=104508 RepID=A0AAU9V3I0_EUPED|nr:unnamed protein product [Euphydryas editha]